MQVTGLLTATGCMMLLGLARGQWHSGNMQERTELQELRALIRDSGLRATSSRIAVLKLMRTAAHPMSHSDVATALAEQTWDRATLYRNLVDMVEVGLLNRTDMGDHVWRYTFNRPDHADDEHPHFVCTGCGTVECLPEVELTFENQTTTPMALQNRQVEIRVRGLCDTCG